MWEEKVAASVKRESQVVSPEAIASQAEEPEGRVVLEKDEVDLCNSVGRQQQI